MLVRLVLKVNLEKLELLEAEDLLVSLDHKVLREDRGMQDKRVWTVQQDYLVLRVMQVCKEIREH